MSNQISALMAYNYVASFMICVYLAHKQYTKDGSHMGAAFWVFVLILLAWSAVVYWRRELRRSST